MDLYKYEAIAHTTLHYCSPITDEMVDAVAQLMNLEPADRVIDIGSAKAEILLRMAVTCQVQAFGIDPSPYYTQAAREAIANRHPAADITLYQQSAQELAITPESYKAVMCVNSSQMYGGYDDAIKAITPLAKSGSMILMGEYFWATSPEVEYFYPTIQKPRNIRTYLDYIETAQNLNLTPLYVLTSTTQELDHYEWMQNYAVEQYAITALDDEDLQAILQTSRERRRRYLKRGRDMLGFGLFLFRKG